MGPAPASVERTPEVLNLRQVTKVYYTLQRPLQALDDVSFTVRRGEFLSIVGPSGCGKSSLLNLIAGLTPPSRGEILYDSSPIAGVNTRVGYITQKDNLLPWQTVWQNIDLPLRIRGTPGPVRQARVRELIDTVGLTGFERHYPAELSGGMRKRVGLARTLIYEPDTLLMDEPFGALDAQLKLILQEELLSIWQRTRQTIVFVTHDLAEAIALADRVIVMSARPARIRLIRQIPLPRPRDIIQLRFTEAFGQIFDELWECLKQDFRRGTEA